MKIVFNSNFYDTTYINDGASDQGRMEAIIDYIKNNSDYEIITNFSAEIEDVLRVHDQNYVTSVSANRELFEMALLSAGGAIKASQIAMDRQEAAFACIRPPGHHAYKDMGWGYCYLNNMAIALKKLRNSNRISSVFVIDFDAHTGDGTINCLSDWNEAKILNPMADTREEYMKLIENYIKELDDVDIIAVNAGFDSYEKDVGRKLMTFDFYKIGFLLKNLSKRMNCPRFAILEGGYYKPDLGKNVLSFCNGFE